jgi:hypothetical protein
MLIVSSHQEQVNLTPPPPRPPRVVCPAIRSGGWAGLIFMRVTNPPPPAPSLEPFSYSLANWRGEGIIDMEGMDSADSKSAGKRRTQGIQTWNEAWQTLWALEKSWSYSASTRNDTWKFAQRRGMQLSTLGKFTEWKSRVLADHVERKCCT